MNEVHDPYHHDNFSPNVPTVLKQRGFVRADCCHMEPVIEAVGASKHSVWFEALRHKTVRKLLRNIARRATVERDSLLNICPEPKLTQHIDHLSDTGVLKVSGEQVGLHKPVDNFGPTLEWYVALMLREEFDVTACWSVQLEEIYGGGDFDVLAWIDSLSALVYVECKSASPPEISESELKHFFQRSQELAPQIAVLLVDTDSNLEPLLNRIQLVLVPLLTDAGLVGSEWDPDERFISPVRDPGYSGVHFGHRRVFVTGSIPSMPTQLSKCLRYYSTWVSHQSFIGGPRIDYIGHERLNG